MANVIRIYGMAPNLSQTPPPEKGVEVWLSNWHKGFKQRLPRALDEWTHYFNLHSRKHMNETYPTGVAWYKSLDGTRPIYFQKHQPDIPGSTAFPRKEVEAFFPEAIGPTGQFYSTCSACWLIPFAIMKNPKRIELWGFELSDRKPGERYKFERPCFFYWVKQIKDRGIETFYQQEIHDLPFICGDPSTYTGTVYGYETKPEE